MFINIPYVLHVYEIDKLSVLVENLDASTLDINLALWHYEKMGVIKIDSDNDKIEVIGPWDKTLEDRALIGKIRTLVAFYNEDGRAVNRGKIEGHTFSNSSRFDPPRQDFFLALDWAVENGELFTETVEVTNKKGKKLKFVVYWAPNFNRDDMIKGFISDVEKSRKKHKLDVK